MGGLQFCFLTVTCEPPTLPQAPACPFLFVFMWNYVTKAPSIVLGIFASLSAFSQHPLYGLGVEPLLLPATMLLLPFVLFASEE